MADASFWAVMSLFGLGVVLAFFFILFATRMMNKEEFRQWEKEIDEWKKLHPVWNILYMFPFPIGTIFTLIGPKFPKRPRIESEKHSQAHDEPENDGWYLPQSSIIDEN